VRETSEMAKRISPSARTTTTTTWPVIDFVQDPRLLVGRRTSRKRLDAQRIRLDRAVFGELRLLCEPTLRLLGSAREREYEQFAELEFDEEFFSLDISDLPTRPTTSPSLTDDPGSPENDTADLVRLVRTVDALSEITRAEMDRGGYTFYAICWPHDETMIGFVSKTNPMTTLQPGLRYFQFGDVLRAVTHPDLALKDGSDIFVGPDRLAIFRPTAFTALLGDVGVIFDSAPANVKALKAALGGSIPMTDGACVAVLLSAQRLISYARRLRALPARLASLPALDAPVLRKSLKKHGIDAEILIDGSGCFSFESDQVDLFLDVLEGRYFEDDLGGERRRADRFSRRT
jgi:hypothetical protein